MKVIKKTDMGSNIQCYRCSDVTETWAVVGHGGFYCVPCLDAFAELPEPGIGIVYTLNYYEMHTGTLKRQETYTIKKPSKYELGHWVIDLFSGNKIISNIVWNEKSLLEKPFISPFKPVIEKFSRLDSID